MRDEKLADFKGSAMPFLDSISAGERLRLREGVYKHIKEREWIFDKEKNDLIFLIHENGAFGFVVRVEDIDWTNYTNRNRSLKL